MAKRELIEPNARDKRNARRDEAQDRTREAKYPTKRGQGDRGDR